MSPFFKGGFKRRSLFKDKLLIKGGEVTYFPRNKSVSVAYNHEMILTANPFPINRKSLYGLAFRKDMRF
jgi:hypothetical protein